ncbi:MAG: SemiSWEET transporter [Flammeovirgaceae bacterium]|nr:SemiSWEET transporter [Flammeovirgaceae bacterium]
MGEIIGLIAAFLTTTAYIPQVIRTWKTKSTGDISLGMYLMMFTGTTCWLIYGIYEKDLPIILANAITVCLSCVILIFKIMNVIQKK